VKRHLMQQICVKFNNEGTHFESRTTLGSCFGINVYGLNLATCKHERVVD